MAIVSRSCRLAGFYRLTSFSLSLSHPFALSLPLSVPRSFSFSHARPRPFPLSFSPREYSFSPTFPSRRQTESEKGVPLQVLSGRYLEENSLFLARDQRNSTVYLDCRCKGKSRDRERKRERSERIRGKERGRGGAEGEEGWGRGRNAGKRVPATWLEEKLLRFRIRCVCSGLIGLHRYPFL